MSNLPISATPVRTNFFGRDESKETGVQNTTREDLEKEIHFGNQRLWSVSADNYYPCEDVSISLPPGFYSPMYNDQRGFFMVKQKQNIDDLIILPDSKSEYIIKQIKHFWKSRSKFEQHGFLWKRGVLLHGLPGSGKTSTLQLVAKDVVDNDGIVVYCNHPTITAECLRVTRRIEPDRPILNIMEDIDAIIQKYSEPDLLALLDGELQIPNILNIATTNYPGQLDDRFIKRPSRFDDIVEVGMPSAAARDVYLKHKHPTLSDQQRALWVRKTEDFPIAAMKEVVVAVECLGRDLDETIDRLKQMMAETPDDGTIADNFKTKVGFT